MLIDFDFGCTLEEALDWCQAHKFKVRSFEEYGPAGGNPNLVIQFNKHEELIDFVWQFTECHIDPDNYPAFKHDLAMAIQRIAD